MGGVLFPSQLKNKNTNAEKIKSREEVGLGNNIKLSNKDKKIDTSKDKKIDTSFDTTKIIDKAKADKEIDSQVDTYVNKMKGDKPINKDLTIDKSAEGKAKYDDLKQKKLEASIKKIRQTEPEDQSKEFGPKGQPSASEQIKRARLAGKTGREKAQELAKMRIGSGTAKNPDTTIQKVKDANREAMEKRAAKRFADFKAKREAKRLARLNKEDYTPYDMVLEYLLSSEQAATIEEANYIMTEMDAETIQSIVSN